MGAGQAMRCGRAGTLFAPPPVQDGMQIVLRLRGRVDRDALRVTLTTFLERHGIPDDGVPFAALDLSREPRGAREADAMVSTIVAEESLTELTSAFRGWLVGLAPDDHVLSLQLRHGYADHETAGGLFQELPEIYRAVRAGRPAPPGVALHPVPAGPVPRVTREIALSQETARALRGVGAHLGVGAAGLVRAAFAAAVGRATGRDRVEVTGPGFPFTAGLSGDPRFPSLVEGVQGGEPAYRVMFESLVGEEGRYGGGRWDDELHAVVAHVDTAPAGVDVAFTLCGAGDGLRGVLYGHVERFPAVRVDRVARELAVLLDAVAANADRTLSQLLEAPPANAGPGAHEAGAGRGAHEAGAGRGVHEVVAAWAAADPDAIAVLTERARLTYGELDRRAGGLAHRLRELGVRAGSVVGVRAEAGPGLAIALLGIWKAGGCCLPLPDGGPATGVSVIVGVDVRLDDPEVLAAPTAFTPEPWEPGRLAAVLPGAGGVPEVVTHEELVARFARMRDACALRPGERVAHQASAGAGDWLWELVWPLAAGARVVVAPGRAADLDRLTDLVEEQEVDVLCLSPSAFGEFVRWDWLSPMPSLRLVVVCDDRPDEDDVARLRAVHDTATAVGLDAGARVHLLDASLRPVPVGVTGELYVGGAWQAHGYRDAPAVTAGRFVPDPFAGGGARLHRTGRHARRRADGTLDLAEEATEHPSGTIGAAGPAHTAGPRDGSAHAAGSKDRSAHAAGPDSGPAHAAGSEGWAAVDVLAGVWAEVLGRAWVGPEDDFFELGGDSITSVQVVSRARHAGLELTSAEIFEHPTLAELAAVARPYPGDKLAVAPALRAAEPVTWLVETPDPIDRTALAGALEALVAHHDALRLRLSPDGPHCVLSLDTSAVVDDEEGGRPDPYEGPLVRVRTEGGNRLLVTAHPLAADAVSWSILLRDLENAYDQAVRGEVIELAAAMPVATAWAGRVEPGEPRPVPDPAPIPLDHPHGRDLPGSGRTLRLRRPAGRLLDAAAPPVDLLLAALALTLTEWTGGPSAAIEVEVDGRAPGLGRAVGPLTGAVPVVITPGDVDGAAARAGEQLRAAPRPTPRGRPQVAMGHVSADAGRWRTSELPAERPGTHALRLDSRTEAGELSLTWTYSRDLHERATVERLAARHAALLDAVIDRCGAHVPTPSDFPLAGLDQTALDLIRRRHGSPP